MVKEFSGKVGTSDGAEIWGCSKKHILLCQVAHSKQKSTSVASITANANEPEILFCKTNFSNGCFPGIQTEADGAHFKAAFSLSSPLRCSSSVSHHDFTHLAINLDPCVLDHPGCEPGCLLGWHLRSAWFCSSCTDTDERWEIFFSFFWLILWGFQQISCLHACPGCHPHHTRGCAH